MQKFQCQLLRTASWRSKREELRPSGTGKIRGLTVGLLHDADPAGAPERVRVAGVRGAYVDGYDDTVLGRLVQHLKLRVTLVPVDVDLFDQVVGLGQRLRATAAVAGIRDRGHGGKTAHRALIVRSPKPLLFQRQRNQPADRSPTENSK